MAWERKGCLAALLLLMVGVVVGQRMTDVCQDVPDDRNNAAKRPRIPQQFRVGVECSLIEQNVTAYVREYYDFPRNRGRLTVRRPLSVTDYYMDYDRNMLLMVNPDTSGCQTGMLLLTQDKFIFGYKTEDQTSHMYSPSGALHFSNVNESYNGTAAIRGVIVDSWVSCQYLSSINATALVTWYFSQKDTWDMQLAGRWSAPVRMIARGKQGMPDGTIKPFNHIYDFFNYEDRVYPSDFEVDKGIYCPGRNILGTPKPFPAVPNSFFFIGEINDPYGTQFTYLEEAFDNTTKFSAFRFKGGTNTNQLTDVNHYSVINDYNSGVSYRIDNYEGSCQLSPVTQSALAFSHQVNGQQVRMETPREFFMDSTVKYQYAGSAVVRNIPAERWVAISDHAKGYVGTNVTVEWYFATQDQESWNNNPYTSATNYRVPILFNLFIPGDVTSQSYQFHIYYYNVVPVGLFLKQVDVSQCYKGVQRRSFKFAIPKSYETTVRDNVISTVAAIQSAVSDSAGISALRVSDIQMYFNPLNVWVTFDILDRPPNYNDVQSGSRVAQNTLDAAANLFLFAFKGGFVTFDLVLGTQVVTVVPRNDSLCMESANNTCTIGLASTQSSSSGYAVGALAGLGIAMLLVGGAGGAVGAFFFFK